MTDPVSGLLAVLLDGGNPPLPLHPEEVTDGLLVRVVIASGLELDGLPPALSGALLRVAHRAGCEDGLPPAEIGARLERYLEANPLPAALVMALATFTREALAAGSGGPDAAASTRLLGAAMSKVPVGQAEAPEGSMKASPLARFTLQVPPKK